MITVRDLKGWAETSPSQNLDLDQMIKDHAPVENRHTHIQHHKEAPRLPKNPRKFFQTEMKQMQLRNKPKLSVSKQAQSQVLRMKASSLSKPSMHKIIKKVSLADL